MMFLNEFGDVVGAKIDLSPHTGVTIEKLLAEKGITKQSGPPQFKAKEIAATEHCVAWRATAGCEATGARLVLKDAPCTKVLYATDSGHCECKGGRTIPASCHTGRAPFKCQDMCQNPDWEL